MKMNEAGVRGGGARVKIPARVESATLARLFSPGEPVVVLTLLGVGNTAPFYFQDKAGRVLVLKWDSRAGGHVIRIPVSLWQANEARLAHDVMEHSRLVNAMIVTFELMETKTEGVAAASDANADATTRDVGERVDASAYAGEKGAETAAEAEAAAIKGDTMTGCTAVSGSVTRTVSAPRAGRGRKTVAVATEMTKTLTAEG